MKESNYQMDSYVRALGRMGATYDIHEKEEINEGMEPVLMSPVANPYQESPSADVDAIPGAPDPSISKQDVIYYLGAENYVDNVVSAEVLHHHITDEFLLVIEELIAEAGRNPKHPYETEQQAEAQKDRRAGKQNREGNKVANKKGPIPDTEGSNTAN